MFHPGSFFPGIIWGPGSSVVDLVEFPFQSYFVRFIFIRIPIHVIGDGQQVIVMLVTCKDCYRFFGLVDKDIEELVTSFDDAMVVFFTSDHRARHIAAAIPHIIIHMPTIGKNGV